VTIEDMRLEAQQEDELLAVRAREGFVPVSDPHAPPPLPKLRGRSGRGQVTIRDGRRRRLEGFINLGHHEDKMTAE
jgi:hypothetical protein